MRNKKKNTFPKKNQENSTCRWNSDIASHEIKSVYVIFARTLNSWQVKTKL